MGRRVPGCPYGYTIGDPVHRDVDAPAKPPVGEAKQAWFSKARAFGSTMTPEIWKVIASSGANYHPQVVQGPESKRDPPTLAHLTGIEQRKAAWIVGDPGPVDLGSHYSALALGAPTSMLRTELEKLRMSALISSRACGVFEALRLANILLRQELVGSLEHKKCLEEGYVNRSRSLFEEHMAMALLSPPTAVDALVRLHEAITREDGSTVEECIKTLFVASHEEVKKAWSASSASIATLQKAARHSSAGSAGTSRGRNRGRGRIRSATPPRKSMDGKRDKGKKRDSS